MKLKEIPSENGPKQLNAISLGGGDAVAPPPKIQAEDRSRDLAQHRVRSMRHSGTLRSSFL
jgi:hypothetical protein